MKEMAPKIDPINEMFSRYYDEFCALIDYNWKMEEAIRDLLEEEKQRWSTMQDAVTRLMRKKGEVWKLLDFFPTTLHYSFIVALYIHTESKLTYICNHIQNTRSLPLRLSHFNGSLIDRSKRYLVTYASLPISNASWSVIDELSKVRDCIVHCNGNILLSRDVEFLTSICQNRHRKFIGTITRNGIEGEWLSFSRNYCMKITADVRDFINSIGAIIGKTHAPNRKFSERSAGRRKHTS
jgi:hypothetical protein